MVSLIGSSGSGKSTFLRCINLLETPTSGDIIVHGDPIRFKNNRKGERIPADNRQVELIRARLSMVFQGFNLWSHMTVLENIIEAPVNVLKIPKKEAIERAEAYLNKVGIYERKDYYPAQMSGGQQQRVGIARALVQQPSMILADEPVASLDPATSEKVLGLLRDICQEDGITAVISLHQLEYAQRFADRIIGLSNAHIVLTMLLKPESKHLDEIYHRSPSVVAAEGQTSHP